MNENNNVPQGLITNNTVQGTPSVPEISPNAPKTKMKINFSNKNNMKIIIGVALIALVAVVLYTVMSGGKGNPFNRAKEPEKREIVALDLDTEWGKEYSYVAQQVYDEQEVDKIDISFINLDFADNPEMIVKYIDKSEREAMVIYYIDRTTGKPKSTKAFTKSDLVLLYSLTDGEAEWYLYINSSKKYGTYTKLSKLIAGSVKSTDEDVRTEKALNEFNEKFVTSDYKITCYEVKLEKFEENFKTIYDRFSKYDDEIYKEKTELEESNGQNVIKRHDEGEYFDTGKYYLSYGVYDYVPIINQDGSEVETNYKNYTITINRDGTFSMNGKNIKYKVQAEQIMLDNGEMITVADNNTIVYNVSGGIKFTAHDPYVKPEEPEEPQPENPSE